MNLGDVVLRDTETAKYGLLAQRVSQRQRLFSPLRLLVDRRLACGALVEGLTVGLWIARAGERCQRRTMTSDNGIELRRRNRGHLAAITLVPSRETGQSFDERAQGKTTINQERSGENSLCRD